MLSSSYLANLVITRGIEQKTFHRLGYPTYNTGTWTIVFGFCSSRVYSNFSLQYLCSSKMVDRYSLLHLCNFSIDYEVAAEESKKYSSFTCSLSRIWDQFWIAGFVGWFWQKNAFIRRICFVLLIIFLVYLFYCIFESFHLKYASDKSSKKPLS